MINLLPPEVKSGYLYGRRNVGLRQWMAIFLIALIGLGLLATYGLATLHQSTVLYTNQISATNNVFKKEGFSSAQQQIKDISSSFKLVVRVLQQEVLFSELLKQIAATIPSNTNLTGLTLGQTQGGVDISAVATDYYSATQVQVNLADPANHIFSKADITNIACTLPAPTKEVPFPCSVSVRALYAANNPFLFINSGSATP